MYYCKFGRIIGNLGAIVEQIRFKTPAKILVVCTKCYYK